MAMSSLRLLLFVSIVSSCSLNASAFVNTVLRPTPLALRSHATLRPARVPAWRMQVAGSSSRRASSSTSSTRPTRPMPDIKFGDTRSTEEILREGRALVEDGLQVLMKTPPRVGLGRTLQATRAVLQTARDVASTFQGRFGSITAADLEAELPRTLRLLFDRLGPTYIKLGQFIASSPTLFPALYVTEFQKCLDNTEQVPFKKIKSIITEELKGRKIEDVYSFIDPVPLATASIAQVHAARLAKNNEDVVIKVQKPGVGNLLDFDLSFLTMATKTLEFLNPEFRRLSLADIASDIRKTMLEELDFEKEAQNIEDFQAFLTSSGINNVVCPFVFKDASSKRILTMSRFYGVPLTDLDSIRQYTNDPESTLLNALNAWMASVVACKSFHADVHAGNLLVLKSGKVAFIDFGIVGTISPKTWAAVEGVARGLTESDYDVMAKSLVTLGATKDNVDTGAFAKDLKDLVNQVESMQVDVVLTAENIEQDVTAVSAALQTDDQEVTQIVLELVALGQKYGIKFPRDFGLLLKQSLYFDRYTKILAPNLQPLQDERLRDNFVRLGKDDRVDFIDV